MIRAQAIENIMNANVTADLSESIKLPTADAGLQVNFGTEYRHEETEFQPDLSYQTGDGAGQGAATLPVAGQFHVTEFFTEVALPLWTARRASISWRSRAAIASRTTAPTSTPIPGSSV
jgi:hypothetical protein